MTSLPLPSIRYDDGRTLLPHHHRHLHDSGIDEQTIRDAGIYSETGVGRIKSLLNKQPNARGYSSRNGPAIVFPFADADGHVVLNRIRPDRPSVVNGRELKYLSPKGSKVIPYLPKATRQAINGDGQIFITEGEKKCLCLTQRGYTCIGLTGVSCWHTKGQTVLMPELQRFNWQGRATFVVFDSDIADNKNVKEEESKLAAALSQLGARVLVIRLPPTDGDKKQGVDDFLVAHGTAAFDRLIEQATPADDVETEVEFKPDAGKVDTLVAAEIIRDLAKHEDQDLRIRFYRGAFYEWKHGCYKIRERDEFRAVVSGVLADSYRRVTSSFTKSVMELLRSLTLVSSSAQSPCWLPDHEGENRRPVDWDLRECLATKKEILHLPSVGTSQVCSIPATPRLFTIAASGIKYDPNAPSPTKWLSFLRTTFTEEFPDSESEAAKEADDSIQALQSWFGYLLTQDTRQHKILMLLGPPRSGKGTISRVLSEIVGKPNVGGPTLASLAQNFGLQSLVDKTLAVISDARLGSKTDQAIIIERLLSISGEDMLLIDRKHRDPLNQQLPTRLMILSNELPRFRDESEALHSRFITLETKRSFLGREDTELQAQLSTELPSILNWAIRGWQNLQANKRLFEPEASKQLKRDYILLTSPVAQFIHQCCQIGDGWTSTQELYRGYRLFCEGIGQNYVENQVHFARNLVAHVRDQVRRGKLNKVKGYYGITLRTGGYG